MCPQILPPKSDPPQAVSIPPNPLPHLDLLLQGTEEDDTPTVKMKIPPHLLAQARGPNWGLIIAVLFCLAFWGGIIYLFWRAHG